MAILGRLQEFLSTTRGTKLVRSDPGGFADSITLDVTFRQDTSAEGEVAMSPVEEAEDVSYAIFLRPATLEVEGLISDTPVQLLSGVRNGPGRSLEVLEKLREWRRQKAIVWVFTRLGAFPDMAIASLRSSAEVGTGQALPISLSFRRVHIIKSALVPSQFDLDARLLGAGGNVEFGTQNALSPRDYQGPTAIQ